MQRKHFLGRLHGFMEGGPRNITPLIFEASKRKKKKCTVYKALEDFFWIFQIKTDVGL
jgi:hypothetical protein